MQTTLIAPTAGRAARHADVPAPTRAEDWLEAPFRPGQEELLSFLVNGMCLIGSHRLLAWEGVEEAVARELEAQGHRVDAAGPGSPPAAPAGAYDRAFRVARALGHGGDEADRNWLASMHKALRPGGLLLFHVLDRDRAWSLVDGFGEAEGTGAAFDPRGGWVTVRIRPGEDTPRGGASRASVKAYNLGDVSRLLEEAGFALERAYGGWQGGSPEEAGAGTGRILVVASKPRRRAAGGMKRKRPGSVRRGAAGQGLKRKGGAA